LGTNATKKKNQEPGGGKPPAKTYCILTGTRCAGDVDTSSGEFLIGRTIYPDRTEDATPYIHEVLEGECTATFFLHRCSECTVIDDPEKPPRVFLFVGSKDARPSVELLAILRSRAEQRF